MAAVTLRILALLFVVSLCSTNVLAKNKKEKKLASVEDMRYGVALYYYYQGDYMAALTELLIAKERGGIKGHGDNPEIMEGGFSLGFGLERHASEIFERLLKENRSRKSQDAAWFFLSKLRYLRADWEGAEDALKKVQNKPSEDIRSEVYAHKINLAIRQDNLVEAQRLLKKRKPDADWLPYLYFNMGAAYARQQDFPQAIRYFEKLAEEKYPTDELRALYDKAMTSSGYAYLVNEEYEKAIDQFSRVRLTSALSNRALLGYGWAAVKLENYQEALKPWQHLASGSLVDENNQEALIAVSYAYEKLGSEGLALQNFIKAEKVFLEEMARLDGVINGMQGNQLLEALKIERSGGMDWLKHVRENQVSPQLSYLSELFSREEFQGVVQELRDLVGIREDFLEWQDKLQFYAELLAERETGRSKKAEELAARELNDSIKRMKAKRAALAKKIETIAANKDFFALANPDEKDLIDRVLRSQKSLDTLRATDPFIDESEEAVRRYYGILFWQSSEQFSDRLWRVVKTLNLLDKTLATVTRNHEKVIYLIENAEDLEPLKLRMADAQDRLDIMSARVDLIIDKTQDDLRLQTNRVLLNQKGRLNHYIAQSRLSIARLYDKTLQATLESETEPDESPDNNDAIPPGEGSTKGSEDESDVATPSADSAEPENTDRESSDLKSTESEIDSQTPQELENSEVSP